MQLLGNVVISKISLRTRKIMVMHSNERGEYRPRTLIDRKKKRYENAVCRGLVTADVLEKGLSRGPPLRVSSKGLKRTRDAREFYTSSAPSMKVKAYV